MYCFFLICPDPAFAFTTYHDHSYTTQFINDTLATTGRVVFWDQDTFEVTFADQSILLIEAVN